MFASTPQWSARARMLSASKPMISPSLPFS